MVHLEEGEEKDRDVEVFGGWETRAKYEWIGLETFGGGRYGVMSSQFHV